MKETTQLLANIEQIDRLSQLPVPYDASYACDEIAKLTRTLVSELGKDGHDALIGSREIFKNTKFSDFESELRAVRLKIIDLFLQRRDQGRIGKFRYLHKLPFRARMQNIAESIQPEEVHKPSLADFATPANIKITLWLLGVLLWMLLVANYYQDFVDTYPPAKPYIPFLVGAITLITYIWGISKVWTILSGSLHSLVTPDKSSDKARSRLVTNYIAAAFLIGTTLIIALLGFDYATHTAASEYEDRKEDAIAKIESKASTLWRIKPDVKPSIDIESDFYARFGSYAGTFGDFFGGILNPILTFGTLLALAITILMQRSQLLDERNRADESAQLSNLQAFETTFFNLLNLHNTSIAHLNFAPGNVLLPRDEVGVAGQIKTGKLKNTADTTLNYAGRPVFASILNTIHQLFPKASQFDPLEKHIKGPSDIYQIIQNRHNDVAGHYFRNLYQILAFVDQYSTPLISRDPNVEHQSRKRYTNILRAQLSSHELSTLFYNCLDSMVDAGAFRALLIEYEFLEHMQIEYIYSEHDLKIKGYDFPINEMAEQYFGNLGTKDGIAGAFGNNPQLAEYFVMQEVFGFTSFTSQA